MKIAIDLRSLSSGSISGVENYVVNLLESLLPLDKKNQYVLFYNSWKTADFEYFHFANSTLTHSRLPNKILNASLKLNLVKLERFTGPIDALFMPNLNQFSILPNTKLAITVHDLSPVVTPEFYDAKRRLWHSFLNYRKAFRRADIIFAVSEYTKYDLMKIFSVSTEKIKVVYPGIDASSFPRESETAALRAIRNDYNLPGNFILFLSTVEPRKNLSGLLQAFQVLESDARLVIVGRRGWKYNRIFTEIRRSKKRDRIQYIGYVSEADKSKIIKLARSVVYPSFYEGFGFVPLEAMSLGVPVVASNVTSVPEVVQDAALLINPYNIDEMRNALEEILNNDPLRATLIEKGKKRSQEFAWQKAAAKVLDGLNSLGT